MAYIRFVRFFSFFIVLFFTPYAYSFAVRVLLEHAPYAEKERIFCQLKCSGGFILEDIEDSSMRADVSDSCLKFQFKDGFLTANGKRYFLQCRDQRDKHNTLVKATSRYVWVKPRKAGARICWNGQSYGGSFLCVAERDSFYIVNTVDSEDYVASVIFAESYADWPLEVQKAFAITVRTYMVHKILEARSTKNHHWFDIKSTNKHQTYKGSVANPRIRKAVKDTENIIIAYNKIPALTMYDVCCGGEGIVPAELDGVNFKEAPYLARKEVCTFCTHCKAAHWEARYTLDQFEQKLTAAHKKTSKLRGGICSVAVASTSRSGGVREVVVKGHRGQLRLSGEDMYALFKKIKSKVYIISTQGNEVIITGRGFGHHMGLCQWGMHEMIVKGGKTYAEALAFYFPKTNLMRIEVV